MKQTHTHTHTHTHTYTHIHTHTHTHTHPPPPPNINLSLFDIDFIFRVLSSLCVYISKSKQNIQYKSIKPIFVATKLVPLHYRQVICIQDNDDDSINMWGETWRR